MIKLQQQNSPWKPMSVEVNGKWLELNDIVIYEKGKVLVNTGTPYFENEQGLTVYDLEINKEKVFLKRKEAFDGSAFVIKDGDYWNSAKEPRYILYLDNEDLGFYFKERFMTSGYIIIDQFVSDKIGSVINKNRRDLEVNSVLYDYEKTFNSIKEDFSFRLQEGDYLVTKLKQLEELQQAYNKEIKRLNNLNLDKLK